MSAIEEAPVVTIPAQPAPQLDVRHLQPLTPALLVSLPPNSFGERIPDAQGRACDAWYKLVDEAVRANLRPDVLRADTEQAFAHAVHRLVASSVSHDTNRHKNPVIARDIVTTNIDHYYALFPPTDSTSSDRQVWQDRHIPRALDWRNRYMEVGVVLGLQRAFVVRRQLHAARATYALLGAYGRALHPIVF